jgi:hypothetical protein
MAQSQILIFQKKIEIITLRSKNNKNMNIKIINFILIILSLLKCQNKDSRGLTSRGDTMNVQNEVVKYQTKTDTINVMNPCSKLNPLGYYIPLNSTYYFDKYELDNIYMDETRDSTCLYLIDTITVKRMNTLGRVINFEYPYLNLVYQIKKSEIDVKLKFNMETTPYCSKYFNQGKDTALIGVVDYLEKKDTIYFTWILGD